MERENLLCGSRSWSKATLGNRGWTLTPIPFSMSSSKKTRFWLIGQLLQNPVFSVDLTLLESPCKMSTKIRACWAKLFLCIFYISRLSLVHPLGCSLRHTAPIWTHLSTVHSEMEPGLILSITSHAPHLAIALRPWNGDFPHPPVCIPRPHNQSAPECWRSHGAGEGGGGIGGGVGAGNPVKVVPSLHSQKKLPWAQGQR